MFGCHCILSCVACFTSWAPFLGHVSTKWRPHTNAPAHTHATKTKLTHMCSFENRPASMARKKEPGGRTKREKWVGEKLQCSGRAPKAPECIALSLQRRRERAALTLVQLFAVPFVVLPFLLLLSVASSTTASPSPLTTNPSHPALHSNSDPPCTPPMCA